MDATLDRLIAEESKKQRFSEKKGGKPALMSLGLEWKRLEEPLIL